jgi:hypothetical protein
MTEELKTFPPEYIDKLLQTPGKTTNKSKQNLVRQLNLNRTRKNFVLNKSDIDRAFQVIQNIVTTGKFDLSEYQMKILSGRPEEANQARHELRAIAIVLRDILEDNKKFFIFSKRKYHNQPFFKSGTKKFLKNTLKYFAPSYAMAAIELTLVMTVSTTGGIAAGGVGLALAVAAAAASVYKIYKTTINEKNLLLLILKILEESSQQPIQEQIFTMTNRNNGKSYQVKGVAETESNSMFSRSNARKTRRKNRK